MTNDPIRSFEDFKVDYATPNGCDDIGEVYYWACYWYEQWQAASTRNDAPQTSREDDLRKRLKTAIGGLRSIAYGDARTWPKEDARLVAIQALEDCGGEKDTFQTQDESNAANRRG